MLHADFFGADMSHLLHSVNVFGFLGGKEVKEEGVGNLGLEDRACKFLPYPLSAVLIDCVQNAPHSAGSISSSRPSEETQPR